MERATFINQMTARGYELTPPLQRQRHGDQGRHYVTVRAARRLHHLHRHANRDGNNPQGCDGRRNTTDD